MNRTTQISKVHTAAWLVVAGISLAGLTACGGGGGGDSPAPTPVADTPPAPTTATQEVSVVDGPIEGAKVCLDKNNDGACAADGSEPSGTTDAAGKTTLTVLIADQGKFPIIAEVGTGAKNGGVSVTTPFTLKTTADKPALVSPLTTLVQAQIESSGSTTAVAETTLKDQIGTSLSLFADPTLGTDNESKRMAALAEVIVKVKQSVTSTVGNTGTALSRDSLGNATALAALTDLAAQVPAGTTLTAQQSQTIAQLAVADAGISAGSATALESRGTATADPAVSATNPAVPGDLLAWFTFTNAQNYSYRTFSSTAADLVPDAQGQTRFRETRKTLSAGVDQPFTRTTNYWTGSQWLNCAPDFIHRASPRDGNGYGGSTYCDSYVNTTRRVWTDISGKRMADVVTQMRAYPLRDTQGEWSKWGPDPALLGAAVFPAKSRLAYQDTQDVATPEIQFTGTANQVRIAPAPNTTAAFSTWPFATTLDAAILAHQGNLVNSAQAANGINTLFVTSVTQAAAPIAGVTAVVQYRAAFDSNGNKARIYRAYVDAVTGFPRNYVALLDTTYRIETLGDAKVLRFAAMPSELDSAIAFKRSFIERGGLVFYGSKDKLRSSYRQYLNTEAWAALKTQLGI